MSEEEGRVYEANSLTTTTSSLKKCTGIARSTNIRSDLGCGIFISLTHSSSGVLIIVTSQNMCALISTICCILQLTILIPSSVVVFHCDKPIYLVLSLLYIAVKPDGLKIGTLLSVDTWTGSLSGSP